MKATIKITQIHIDISEFGSTQAIMIRYFTNHGSKGPSGVVFASRDFMNRRVEKLTETLVEEGCNEVNVIDQRAEEIK